MLLPVEPHVLERKPQEVVHRVGRASRHDVVVGLVDLKHAPHGLDVFLGVAPVPCGIEIAQAFFAASRQGELPQLEAVLAEDVVVYTDGGGKVRASARAILGRGNAARFFAGISRKPNFSSQLLLADCTLDGLPGFITREAGGLLQTTALDIFEDKIRAIYITRNPDKLTHLSDLVTP